MEIRALPGLSHFYPRSLEADSWVAASSKKARESKSNTLHQAKFVVVSHYKMTFFRYFTFSFLTWKPYRVAAVVILLVCFYHYNDFFHLQLIMEPKFAGTNSTKSSFDQQKRRGEDVFRNSTCPWIFGLGSQKCGSTAAVYALGNVAQVLAKNDISQIWTEAPKTDEQLLQILHNRNGLIQKEGHGIQYLEQIRRICPDTRYYVVTRDLVQNVRSIADRLGIWGRENCSEPEVLERFPSGWRPLFLYSNSSSCHIRLAHFHMDQYGRIMDFVHSLPFHVPVMRYEDFSKNQTKSIIDLCEKLDYLSCNRSVVISYKQHQTKGRNAGKNITDLWSDELFQSLTAMEQKEKRLYGSLGWNK